MIPPNEIELSETQHYRFFGPFGAGGGVRVWTNDKEWQDVDQSASDFNGSNALSGCMQVATDTTDSAATAAASNIRQITITIDFRRRGRKFRHCGIRKRPLQLCD
jgi:hypothetical protein